MRLTISTVLALLAFVGPVRADTQPYHLKIVLHCARHRMLTEVFREKLERELGDGLQAALGGLATVEVVREHELLKKIEERGLQAELERWTQRSTTKTHFLLIDYADAFYHVRGLQHDGLTGQTGPVVRREKTRDRDFVARLAALMIKDDFGLVGTVGAATGKDRVKFLLQGPPGAVWSKHVRVGDVFALVRVEGTTGPAELVRSAYLQVETPPRDDDPTGECVCVIANRYQLPTLTGYRALQLGTRTGPLRLRLVRPSFTTLGQPMSLAFRQRGFTGEDPVLTATTNDQDTFDTNALDPPRRFEQLVFVTIARGGTVVANVPIPLVDASEVLVPVSADAGGEGDDPLRVLRETWSRAVADAYLLQTDQMQRIQARAAKAEQRAETIQLVRKSLERTRADVARLRTARAELGTRVAEAELTAANERLKKLDEGAGELQLFLERLEAIEAKENSPERREALTRLEQAKLLLGKGEVRQALTVCRDLLAGGIDLDGTVPARIAELEKLEPKTDPHRVAWNFIYDEWPKFETPDLLARLDEARQAFAECKKAGDKFGPRKLLDLNVAHALRLDKEVSSPRPVMGNPDEQPTAARLRELVKNLGTLSVEIKAYLDKGP